MSEASKASSMMPSGPWATMRRCPLSGSFNPYDAIDGGVGRLLPDGSVDTSFGDGGWIVAPAPDRFKVGSTAGALDPQGRLLVAAAGSAAPEGSGNGYLLARFLLGPNA